MKAAAIRFYEELNDFLPEDRRKRRFSYPLTRRASVKDVIESLGVPHTEVDLILVNSESVNFGHLVEDGDDISVYPVFERLDIQDVQQLRPRPLRTPRFVVDCNLGRLARYLRLLGFDSLYDRTFNDAQVADISHQQLRITLTRDRRLLHRKLITHGCYVRETHPVAQLVEVIGRLDLHRLLRPFTRCTTCNGLTWMVNKADIDHLLEPRTRRYYQVFHQCRDCGKLYWRGSHYQHALRLIETIQRLDSGSVN